MASTRSNLSSRSATQPAARKSPRDALVAVARDGVRIQIAALTAAGKAIAGWTYATDRFAQAVDERALAPTDGLPRAATNHFDTRLSRASIDN
jgi:hypothetical protein